jgi:ubiquinone/menaquinone biosynthesis C-methylase UbiE
MAAAEIRFTDGAAYDRMMGGWSRLAADVFLDWLSPSPGLRWADIGCGSGAFTGRVCERVAPAEVQGIDPSEAQLAFARQQHAGRPVQFHHGDAMALPFPDNCFDAAVMALVIFFVPEPRKGVAEMARIVVPGGIVAAYAWDVLGGGYPGEPVRAELRALGIDLPTAPRIDAARIEALKRLWVEAGMEAVETREITVFRTFVDFDDFWTTTLSAASIGPSIAALPAGQADRLKERVRARLPADKAGRITYAGCANAVKGRVR